MHVRQLHAAEDVLEADQVDQFAFGVEHADVADVALGEQHAHAVQAVVGAAGDERPAGELAERAVGRALRHQPGDVALGEDAVAPRGRGGVRRAVIHHDRVHPALAHAPRRLAQPRRRGQRMQAALDQRIHPTQLEVVLDALVQHHVGLRHDAHAPAGLVLDHVVAHMLLAEAHGQLVQRRRRRHHAHRRAHHGAYRQGEGRGVVEIHPQRVALGPDAHHTVVLDHQDRAHPALAHAPRGLVQGLVRGALEQVAADDLADAGLVVAGHGEGLLAQEAVGFRTVHGGLGTGFRFCITAPAD